MTDFGNVINVPMPGSPRFQSDTAKAIGRIRAALGPDGSPTFSTLALQNLDASRLVISDADQVLVSVDLIDLVAGTANEINVADDGSGGVTIGIVDPIIVAKGGTGLATLTDHGILLGSGTGAVTPLGAATNGQLPIGNTGADPVIAALTGTTDQVIVTNGAGSITLSTPQDLATDSSVQFGNSRIVDPAASAISPLGTYDLAVIGPNASVLNYPSFNFYTDADNYPLMGFLPYAHGNTQLRFENYYNGVSGKEVTSHAGGCYRLGAFHSGTTNYITLDGHLSTFQGEEFDNSDWYGGLTYYLSPSERIIINNQGIDMDFWVKGDGDGLLINTDAANDRVGIGVVPLAKLDVGGTCRLGDSTTNYVSVSATGSMSFVGSASIRPKDVWPVTDNTYYLGKNDDDTPFAWKGVILKDQGGTGKYYRLEVVDDALQITDLTD